MTICPECKGLGYYITRHGAAFDDPDCDICNGTGRLKEELCTTR